jgi:hypothetical protein
MNVPAGCSAILSVVLFGFAATTGSSETSSPCRPAGGPVPLVGLHEASGVAASRAHHQVLWTHNDSGPPVVVAIDPSGSVKARVRVTGATVEDWEDIAVGACPSGSCLYIADIGDNDGKRSSISIYRVPEPAADERATPAAEVYRASYPEGPRDAEAFFVTRDGGMFIVTKGVSTPTGLYRFPRQARAGATVTLERIGQSLGEPTGDNERITGGAVSPDDRWVALRTHDAIRLFDAAAATAGRWQEVHRVDVRALREPQGEGITFAPDGSVYLVGEGGKNGTAGTLGRLECNLSR